jgi:dTDP-4-dehydrorhamnose reductase
MRVLITGSNGQLGRELQSALTSSAIALSHSELDITDGASVARAITGARPDVVVHAAALTNTTICEQEPAFAMQVNAAGAENVAKACAAAGAALVYVSTNEVFDGAKKTPYIETDATGPLNEYGRSKLAGERRVRAALPQHYVVRTSWVYGAGGDNFVTKVLRWAETGKLTGVIDEISTPTWARDLAQAIAKLVATDRFGIYHFTNSGDASRYDWAREILLNAGKTDVTIEPITTQQFRESLAEDAIVPTKPRYSVLANAAGAALGIELQPWQDALAAFFDIQA